MAKEKIVLGVEGMSCGHCENRVKKAVGMLDGVSGVEVNLPGKTVAVEYDPSVAAAGAIRQAIEEQGYEVVPDE